MRALRNLKFLSAALLCVAIVGTAGYHYIEHWTWFDGFYMVLTTLATMGCQEVHPLPCCCAARNRPEQLLSLAHILD